MSTSPEAANKREPLVYEGQKLWSMGNFSNGSKGWTYGDGNQELLTGPDPERAGGVPVTVRGPLSRNETVRIAKVDGQWEARRT